MVDCERWDWWRNEMVDEMRSIIWSHNLHHFIKNRGSRWFCFFLHTIGWNKWDEMMVDFHIISLTTYHLIVMFREDYDVSIRWWDGRLWERYLYKSFLSFFLSHIKWSRHGRFVKKSIKFWFEMVDEMVNYEIR